MARAKLDHAMEFKGVIYPEDTEVEVDPSVHGTDEDGVVYAIATFPDGEVIGVPDMYLRKWIEESNGQKYWLKSFHDIEAGEIQVTVVDEKGTRSSVVPPRTEHL